MFENLRRWQAKHPHPGGTVNSAEELRELVARKERQRAETSGLTLKDEPPAPGT